MPVIRRKIFIRDAAERAGAGKTEEEMNFAVLFEKTDTGYSAHIPDLPGCIAAGADLHETQQLIREAVEMHLEGMHEDGDPIPQPTTITDYVTVPQDIAG